MPTVIKCIVPDKKVVEVLRALKPYALDPPVADPIDEGPINSAIKVVGAHNGFKALIDNYIEKSAKSGKKTITTAELKNLCTDNGGQWNSYSYGLKLALNNKKLRKTKDPKTYEVIG